MVVQQGWPGCPQASHWETPPIATQVFPALHEAPVHGCPVAPVPPAELPLLPEAAPPPLLPELDPLPLRPEPEPPLLPPEAAPPPLLPDMAPPLPAPSEPASGVAVEESPPPHPASDRARSSPDGV